MITRFWQRAGESPQAIALSLGLALGGGSVLLAFMLVELGPVLTFGFVLALMVALYAATSLEAALILLMTTAALLPFGTLPFRIAFTPTLIECALVVFLGVYALGWMRGQRRDLHLTPVTPLIVAFLLLILFAFLLGWRGQRPSFSQINEFATLFATIAMSLVLADVAADVRLLRRVTFILLLTGAAAGVLGVVLWALPDASAEALLNRLGRIGYPTGGVLRYREDGVRLGNERAIGTWVDPNAYAGFLLMVGGLVGAQLFSPRPVTGPRWLAFACFGAVGLALFLSDSRGAMLGLGAGLGVVALLRYRRLLWLGALAVGLILLLPVTQGYVAKFVAGLTAADLETQMRLGEYQDALRLIAEYPVFGVGFTSVPTIDLYVGFSSTYLTLAAYAGLVGLAAYLLAVGGALVWGLGRWYSLRERADLADVWLGLLAGVVGALIGGLFDHFYFNPRYQATSLMFWALVGLLMAATRLSQPAKTGEEGGQASIYLPPRG